LDSRYRVVHKNWGNHKLLDLDVNPDGFVAWRERALGFLTTDRPDVRRLLVWAERQTGPITENDEVRGAQDTFMMEDVDRVSYVVFEAVKSIMADALLARARACGEGRGLELWRRLHSEWRGSAPQVIAAKARRYQDPARSHDMKKLWEALPVWEQLGNEVIMAGYPVPDWVKAQALDKLLPLDLLNTVVSRPELSDYVPKMKWVKAQMEHARGATLASQVANKGGKDMEVGAVLRQEDGDSSEAVSSDSVVWSLQSELGRRSAAGDWDAVNALTGALFALGKGKGKSKGGGKSGSNKGASKGNFGGYGKGFEASGFKGKGKGADGGKGEAKNFDGYCNYCWKYGHRKSECRMLDAEMAKKGKGKGKGKGAYELQEEEHYGKDDKEDAQEGSDEEWWVGAVCALSREDAFARVDPRRSAKPRSGKDLQTCPTKVHNMYAGLVQDDDEYEAARGGQVNEMEAEPDARVDVGDSTGRVPHTQGVRGTPTRNETGAWRTSLCGEPACRPPRVGTPHGHSGGVNGAPVKYQDGKCSDFKKETFSACATCHGSGAGIARSTRRGTPPRAKHEGFVTDLHSWPKVSGDAETRAPRRTRSAENWCRDSGKCLKTFAYKNKDLDLLVTEAALERFVGAVAKDEGDKNVRIVEAVVDSGAEESVAPPGCFPGVVGPSRMSRAGGKYRAANGARIPNLGQVKVPFMNEEGDKCGIMFQVAEVERPLISATQLAASGNAVIIDGKGARIVNMKTKKVMKLVKRGGVYVLRMRVKADPAPGFPGPGK
jgi:hypothetical protein